MNCPGCATLSLESCLLESGLTAWRCLACGGLWINSQQLWRWLDGARRTAASPAPTEPVELPLSERKGAKLCPECSHLLAKFRVGQQLEFSLDHCGNCGGVWLDRNEWEMLKSRGLHTEIHLIFSDVWQHRIRRDERARQALEAARQRIGAADFAPVERFREWLQMHPRRSEILAYLSDPERGGQRDRD